MNIPVDQIVSMVGCFLILAAFAANTFGWLPTQSYRYQWLNLLGAICLTYTAVVGKQYGFIVLEGCWGLVSIVTLFQMLMQKKNQESLAV